MVVPWYSHLPEPKVRRTPPRMLLLLAWRRLRYPRPRTVLWGHRRFDRSPRGLEVIGPAEAVPVRERLCAWLRVLDLEPDEVYEIEAGTVGMRVHRWARDEDGQILMVEGPDGLEPKRQPPLELLYGAAGPPPTLLSQLTENVGRMLGAFGVRQPQFASGGFVPKGAKLYLAGEDGPELVRRLP